MSVCVSVRVCLSVSISGNYHRVPWQIIQWLKKKSTERRSSKRLCPSVCVSIRLCVSLSLCMCLRASVCPLACLSVSLRLCIGRFVSQRILYSTRPWHWTSMTGSSRYCLTFQLWFWNKVSQGHSWVSIHDEQCPFIYLLQFICELLIHRLHGCRLLIAFALWRRVL